MSTPTNNPPNNDRYYIGILIALFLCVFIPIFAIFAFVEALLVSLGYSVIKYIPERHSQDEAVQGAFLVFKWFGNLLWFVAVFAFLIGIFI